MSNELTVKTSPFEISTFGEAERFAATIAKSDFAPKDYKGKPENVMIAMQFGYELGLKPMQAIQNIAVVNGRPMVWGDAALALVVANQECKGINETITGTFKDKNIVARCEVRRKNDVIVGEFTFDQAVKAGLLGKPGPWSQYPERMLKLRARGFALRDSFPDVLKGVYIEGELLPDDQSYQAKPTATAIIEEMIHPKIEAKETLSFFEQAKKAINDSNSRDELEASTDLIRKVIDKNELAELRTAFGKKLKDFKESVNQDTGEVMEAEIVELSEYEKIKKQIQNAKSVDTLDIAADLIRTLSEDEGKDTLTDLYKTRRKELEG